MATEYQILKALQAVIEGHASLNDYCRTNFERVMGTRIIEDVNDFEPPGVTDWPLCYLMPAGDQEHQHDDLNGLGNANQSFILAIYIENQDKEKKIEQISYLCALMSQILYTNCTLSGLVIDVLVLNSWVDASELFTDQADPAMGVRALELNINYQVGV